MWAGEEEEEMVVVADKDDSKLQGDVKQMGDRASGFAAVTSRNDPIQRAR